MTYLTDRKKIHLPRSKDRRVRVSDAQRVDIQTRYKSGQRIREIARAYEGTCSRRLIQFIIFPERAKINSQNYIARGQAKESYAKVRGEKWAKIMREHRHYKQDTLRPEHTRKHLRKD